MFSKRVTPKKKEPAAEAVEVSVALPPIEGGGGLLCDCGEPVAPGQNQVCAKHIRTN